MSSCRLGAHCLVGALLLSVACHGPPSGDRAAIVPSGAFALVGARTLSLELLSIARAGHSAPDARESKDRVSGVVNDLVRDTLLAEEARSRLGDYAASIERGTLARALFEQSRQKASELGPLTQAELDAQAARLWVFVDRPQSVRTVDLVAVVPPLGDGAAQEEVMQKVALAVRGASSVDDLKARAESVPRGDVQVIAHFVPPLTADGRIYARTPADEGTAPPPPFYAASVAKLTSPFEVTEVIPAEDGYHVIVATEILPPFRLDGEERAERLRGAALSARAEKLLEPLRRELREKTLVRTSQRSAALTELVWRARESE